MNDRPVGPLKLPLSLLPSTKEAARAVRALTGHSTSDAWLPEGLGFPELDDLRDRHLRLRGQVAAELAELAALVARDAAEDRQHDRDLQQAHRDGNTASVEDRRTPAAQRQADREAVLERYWSGVIVLAEVVGQVVAWYRQHEDEVLASLRSQLGPAQEKRREAERLLAEAKAEEWALHRLGHHVQITADDGAFGRQPAPTPEAPPKEFSAEVAASMLERPWHKRREHDEPPVVAWLDSQPDPTPALTEEPDDASEAPLADGDPTGQLSELVETGAGS